MEHTNEWLVIHPEENENPDVHCIRRKNFVWPAMRGVVVWAKNGQEAINHFKEQTFNLVIMDIRMPIKNGYETIQEMKELNEKIPIVIQTAFSDYAEKEKGFKAGCDNFITHSSNRSQHQH